jgi:hypothetical protein
MTVMIGSVTACNNKKENMRQKHRLFHIFYVIIPSQVSVARKQLSYLILIVQLEACLVDRS